MVLLRSITWKGAPTDDASTFPFSVPAIRSLSALQLDTPVTFFVGENGSGKSTLLEGIAAAVGLPAIGSDSVRDDASLAAQRALGSRMRLAWTRRSHRGFFLRAENFFGFTKYLARLRAELRVRLQEIEVEYEGRSAYARGLAMGPASASLAAQPNNSASTAARAPARCRGGRPRWSANSRCLTLKGASACARAWTRGAIGGSLGTELVRKVSPNGAACFTGQSSTHSRAVPLPEAATPPGAARARVPGTTARVPPRSMRRRSRP